MPHRYSEFGPTDFDKYDCVTIAKGIYLILIFVLRGYLVWLMSVTNMQDRVGVISWIYPQPPLFYLSLASGALGLFVVLLLGLRRPDAKPIVKILCKKLRSIIVAALIFDWVVNIIAFYYWQMQSVNWLIINTAVIFIAIWYLYTNKRVQLNLQEFPEKLPEK